MSIKDCTIKDFLNPVSSLPDEPLLQSDELKAIFDSNSMELKAALNKLIEDILSQNAANELGATPFAGCSSTNIQGQLNKLSQDMLDVVASVLPAESIDERKLQNNSVSTDKIVSGAVTNDKIADSSVTFNKLSETAIASSEDAVAGTSSSHLITPQKLSEFIVSSIATPIESAFGKVTDKLMTPDCTMQFYKFNIRVGSYTGDGQATRNISLGGYGRFVIITSETYGFQNSSIHYGGFVNNETTTNPCGVSFYNSGFTVTYSGNKRTNELNRKYMYLFSF